MPLLSGAWRRRLARMAGVVGAALLPVVTIAQAADYVGAERCAHCHVAEYEDWRASGHATAFARLSRVQQRDPVCRSCHTMVPQEESAAFLGVQCESCHGAGALYAPRHVMKDSELAKLLGLVRPGEEQCAPCHTTDTPGVRKFHFQDKLPLVRHRSKKALERSDSDNVPSPPLPGPSASR